MAPVDVYWYDGHQQGDDGKKVYNRPARPEGVPADQELGDGDMNGSFLIGDGGVVTQGEYGGTPRLLPNEKMADYTKPEPTLERIPDENPYLNWLEACKGGKPAASNFDYAGPFTEMVNFGNLTVKSGKKLHWDNRRASSKTSTTPPKSSAKNTAKAGNSPSSACAKIANAKGPGEPHRGPSSYILCHPRRPYRPCKSVQLPSHLLPGCHLQTSFGGCPGPLSSPSSPRHRSLLTTYYSLPLLPAQCVEGIAEFGLCQGRLTEGRQERFVYGPVPGVRG